MPRLRCLALGLTLGALLFGVSAAIAGDALRDFERAWRRAKDTEGRIAAIEGLRAADSPEAAEALLEYGFDPRIGYRLHDAAFEVLSSLASAEARAWVATEGLAAKASWRRVVVVEALASWPAELARPALLRACDDEAPSVRIAAVEALAEHPAEATVTRLITLLGEARGTLRESCRESLRRLTGQARGGFDEWRSWWAEVGEGFDFAAVAAARRERVKERRGKLATTTDGSALYETIVSERVLFVVDSSGSMAVSVELEGGGTLSRLDYVKRELEAAIMSQLDGRECRFGVLRFSSDVTSWSRELEPATARNKRKAIDFVKTLQPTGGTNTYGALEAAFSFEEVDTIYLLTDGSPTEGELSVPETIIGRLRKWNRGRQVKVHGIAFLTGDGAAMGILEDKAGAKDFVRRVADENGGDFRAME